MTPTPTQELIAKATGLRAEVAVSLQDWVEVLRERAAEGYADDEFYDRVEEVKGTVKDWILHGFGEGLDAWTDRALKEMRVNKSSASFAEHALNSIRVEISGASATSTTCLSGGGGTSGRACWPPSARGSARLPRAPPTSRTRCACWPSSCARPRTPARRWRNPRPRARRTARLPDPGAAQGAPGA